MPEKMTARKQQAMQMRARIQKAALDRGMLFEWWIYEEKLDLVQRGRKMAAALLRGLQS